jgi:uncharacterized protein (TIGR02001 family)
MTIREGSRMNGTSARYASFGAASLLAAALLAAPAFADGLPTKGKTRGPDVVETRPCAFSGNVGVTSDYVFRGISQTLNDPALQGGVEVACGQFYAGFWGSNVDFGAVDFFQTLANVEIDLYGGFRTKTGPVAWDIGFIYYAYPGQLSGADLDFVELKVGASGEVWKGGTLGGTVFYSPDYTGGSGPVWTLEGTFSQALPKVGFLSPTFSATLGSVNPDDFDDYLYWNAGLTLGFLDKWSLDLRYWDTDIDGGCRPTFNGSTFGPELCDARFVAAVKYSF